MLIKGIRSFDPENRHVITFFKPLTLIVGPNGAGKTTIIECLKLACTGELPPNARSGHSFIHDPKVAGETETKGQIKLRFKTAAGKDVVCIRSFQLTQKASKMEYKALESVLQTINPHTGEKVCLSYRCADMDREIPALMGVSKAILENVIFAHQDEANWPLQDPSTLKKKFDDIFSATRYTKALEVIKKLHKEQAQEIKTYKLKLENLQTLRDSAFKLRESISQDQEKTETLKIQIQELQRNIQDADAKIQETEETLKEMRKIQEKILAKTAERSTLVKESERQYKALDEENTDSDEDLKKWKTSFDEHFALLESKISKQERELNDLELKSSSLKETKDDNLREISKLQNEAEVLALRKNERDATIQNLFARHNLGSLPSTPFSDEVAWDLINRIESRLVDLEKDLKDKKKSNEIDVKMVWSSYQDANDRWKNMEARKQAKVEIKRGILNRIEEKKKERDALEFEISNVDLAQIDEQEERHRIKIESLTKQLTESDTDAIVRQKKSEIYTIEQDIKALNRDKNVLDADSENRFKLTQKKSELENAKKKHKKIMDEYRDKIREALKGRLPPDRDLKKEVSLALRALAREVDEMNSKSHEAEKEVNLLEVRIEEVAKNLSKHRKDMDSRKRFIESKLQSLGQSHGSVDSYPGVLDTTKEKRDTQKSKYNIADGMRQMFDPFERVARAHHFCPCCERPFSAEEEDDFVKKQRVKAASSAEHMKVLAMETSNVDSVFQQLDKLRVSYEEYVKIGRDMIPPAERTLNDLKEDLGQKSQALDDVVGVLAQIKSDKDSVEALMERVDTADRLYQEIQALQMQVEKLEDELDLAGLGLKSKEDIESELNNLQTTKERLLSEVEDLKDNKSTLEKDLSTAQLRWYTAREDKAKNSAIVKNLEKAEMELYNLTEEKSQNDLDEKFLEEALDPLRKEKDKWLDDHNRLKDRLTNEFEKQAEIKRKFEHEVEKLQEVTSKIKEYYDLRKGERLKELQDKEALSESQNLSCEAKIRQITTELNDNKELKMKRGTVRRNIEDNLNYRKTKADITELTREIESLEHKILKFGGVSASENDLMRVSQERERLLSELNRCQGTSSVYQSNISKNKVDLKQVQYKDIDKRYFDQMILLKTTEMANKDLDRYYNALDKALMRFHSMKMEEINKIIRELWQQTYRGQDIDYIRIHSDSEGAGTRSYSYKVVMQTGDTELEMRGRCSAGQKVLASLIIRLALAETFCLHCGILALDEPTTNLDGPNAESLAAALLRIMEDRKGQENFQLIVITHDERFAQLIGQRQHAERYYRVAKDDHQHSIIEVQEIFD